MRTLVDLWLDRINRYRLAAAVLVIPFFLSVLVDLGWADPPMMLRRGIYWFGLSILLVSVALDAHTVYAGKRKVKRMIQRQLRR